MSSVQPTPSSLRRSTLILPARPANASASPKRVDSGSLLSGNRELIIEHAGCEYRLRRTQNDKLILTK
jgi:hemin uptake protein HemP